MFTATLLLALSASSAEPAPAKLPSLAGMRLRLLGPATTSGRVVGFAVHPKDRTHYYVAAASGGVWKTTNAGTTWTPIFDDQGSYSIGTVVLDPKNPSTVWVGTGENNSQRSVGYGDGVYRSDDGGKTWRNVGLKDSEHIGRIVLDPRDSETVYVAAQGPLWGPGGDRGLYKTTDGGKHWKKVLDISENTGVTDVVLDPRNPDVLLAAAYQRRRHVWTLINGGPESALYKSTDAGKTWKKLKTGLPAETLGRIGLAVAPSDPDTVYTIIESIDGKGGIFRSTDFGETWEKRNDYDQQAQYYSHLVVDPKNKDRLYVMGVLIQVSDDGGRTLRRLGERFKHVDNHAMWIDPNDPKYYLVGCDGGIYESFDRAATWHFKGNLPITQFYDVTCDETAPFYHVYGGTQDNFTMGGPARTRNVSGITNADWFVVLGGDGFQCKVDPKDPDTVYAELQYGVLTRFNRRTGQSVGIQPQEGKGEPPLRWNWDSALLLSPHKNTRLYFAANRVFKSDDRGDSWTPVSGDLTRQINRDSLPVMGKVWGPDAVAKHLSTSIYGNIVALVESPRKEGLLYAGTDDGLIQVTEDGGKNWRKVEKFADVPDRTYVSRIVASHHDANTVYASFDNHKNADFKPYLLRSKDAGKTWSSVAGDLPERGSVLAFAEDHVDPNLLFVGTEFALYASVDGGQKWHRLRGGLPTIAVKDLAVHKRMNDLVVGTFGRGIYVLDDYTPLRNLKPDTLAREGAILPVRDAWLYVPSRPLGGRGKGMQGESFYTADNPAFGATFTYHLKETLKSKKQKRRDAERDAERKGDPSRYPSKDELRAEDEEEPPTILLTVTDSDGRLVRTLRGPATAGIQRVTWDLRQPAATLPRPRQPDADEDPFAEPSTGPLVMPGAFKVSLAKRVDGVTTQLAGPVDFNVIVEGQSRLSLDDLAALREFQGKMLKLERAVAGALGAANEVAAKLDQARIALDQAPGADSRAKESVRSLIKQNRDILMALRGDAVSQRRNENTPPSIADRVQYAAGVQRFALARPTKTAMESYDIASSELAEQMTKLRKLVEVDFKALEKLMDEAGAPWTPGRLPEWTVK